MFSANLQSPLGNIRILANEDFVYEIAFAKAGPEEANALTTEAKQQLEAYFREESVIFDFPMQQEGTAFQQLVREALLAIPAGQPISYASFSERMNQPLAIRAIAAANGKNKLAIVVPCHRVIGSNGKLVGYAGELWRKQWLLNHEAKLTGIGQTSLFL